MRAWCGSARPERRACGRRAAPARRGRSCRSPRRSPAGRRRPDASARRSRLSGRALAAIVPTRPCPSRNCARWTEPGFEAFGGVEFEHAIGAQHVERAHFGHHVLGDLAHDAVEPLLRLERLRHQFAQPFQQNARAGGHVTHRGISSRQRTAAGSRHRRQLPANAE